MITKNILQGDKVRLTALSKDDLPAMSSWYEDAGFLRLFDATPAAPKSQEQLETILAEQQKEKNLYLFAIRPKNGSQLLGYAELDDFLWAHQNCWLGLGFGDRENWGKGFGREAMELVLKFAFDELNLHRVQLTVFSYNDRAIALYERLGFQREGTYREFLHREGSWHDMYLYGLLNQEWVSARGR